MDVSDTDMGSSNAALVELDQKIRVGNLGEQSEAIVKFPGLFEKYPFPILINSALLKLGDLYRQSCNFIKVCVLNVCLESERHLDKITNVDEFLKRLFSVLHSNDPVARALTLRTLASMASIIPERKSVHHNIRNSLDSHDKVELEAAIIAATKFAQQSKNFSINMCSKISEMIEGYSTPLDIKVKLIPIFEHMGHDGATARMVRNTCTSLLAAYPSQNFVIVTLHTLTQLSGKTLIDIPEHVSLLLRYLTTDCRRRIKNKVLSDLRFLASENRAHLWNVSNVSSLIDFASSTTSDDALIGALNVLCDIVKATSTRKINPSILELTADCSYRTNYSVSLISTQLLTLIAIYGSDEQFKDVFDDAVLAIESLFLVLGSEGNESNKVYNETLTCIVLLCNSRPSASKAFVDLIGSQMLTGTLSSNICDVLAALGHKVKGVLNPLLPNIYSIIYKTTEPSRLRGLITLLLQCHKGHSWSPEALSAFNFAHNGVDDWTKYRMARTATRYGHHFLAHSIYSSLANCVSSSHHHYWLLSLSQVCSAESLLRNEKEDILERILKANSVIHESIISLKATTNGSFSFSFQIHWLSCRSEFLQAAVRLLTACHSLRTSPPPAISNSASKLSHDELWRCGRVTQLLRKSVKDFLSVGNKYSQLYETSFDADPESLLQLRILHYININLGKFIEIVILKNALQGSLYRDVDFDFSLPFTGGIDLQDLIYSGEKMAHIFQNLASDPTIIPIDHRHTAALNSVIKLLILSPLPLPRFFYQSLQSTKLKLAVSPAPRTPGEPITVSTSTHLAVKVEGVISQSFKWRKIGSVGLTLSAHLTSPSNQGGDSKMSDCNLRLEQNVLPHNDFFTGQFLVLFPVPGLHQIVIETQFIDEEEQVWSNTDKKHLNIKAFEDGASRPSNSRNRI